MRLCNLGTVEPPGSELSPIDWGFVYHSGGYGLDQCPKSPAPTQWTQMAVIYHLQPTHLDTVVR
eukprot:COSAG06_NODE_61030_length_269_cov_0.600000_1_plen_63_part_01